MYTHLFDEIINNVQLSVFYICIRFLNFTTIYRVSFYHFFIYIYILRGEVKEEASR